MDPLSIIGAVQTGAEVLGSFIALVQRYIALPTAVLDNHESFRGCEHVLNHWKRKWGVEEHHPALYYEVLWGRNGWEEIRQCLAVIGIICAEVNGDIDDLVTCATGQKKPHINQQSYDRRFDEELVRANVKRIQRSMGRSWRFSRALTNKAGDLEDKIARFESKLRNLRRMSNGNAERVHGENFQKIRHLRGPVLIQRLTGRNQGAYRRVREEAKVLYKALALSGRQQVDCHLNFTVQVSPISISPAPEPLTDFQVLLEEGSVSMEVHVYPGEWESHRRRPPKENLSSALDELTRSGTKFCRLLPRGCSNDQCFVVQKSDHARLNTLREQPTIRTSFYQHSLSRKAGIATTLAEGCYRLLGTPWLDSLDSGNVRADCMLRNTWTAMLHMRASNPKTTQDLERMANSFRRPGSERSITQNCHIYRLGIVLTELALGYPITHTSYDRRDGMKVVIDRVSDQSLDAYAVAAEVEAAVNEKYADVVFFCLSVLQDRRLISLGDFDEEFGSQVLDPLNRLMI